jgi:hypothetical protein
MRKGLALIVAAALLVGCSRDGFEDSLKRSTSDAEQPQQQSSQQLTVPQGQSFDLVEGEFGREDYMLIYALPNASSSQQKAAASEITGRIEQVLLELPEYFNMGLKGAVLEVYDGITKNDGALFSVYYQGSYKNDSISTPTNFSFGLSFEAKTGRQLSLSDVAAPYTLASLLLDAKEAKMLTKTGDMAIAQREYLSSLGLSALADRIVTASPQRTAEQLMTFSFYLEEGSLIALIPVESELGYVARVAVENPYG